MAHGRLEAMDSIKSNRSLHKSLGISDSAGASGARHRTLKYSLRFASLPGLVLALGLAFQGMPQTSHADDSEYLANLKVAQAKVMRVKKARLAAASLSSPLVKSLFGRYYQVGDSWDVAAFEFMNPMARMTSDPEHLKMGIARSGIFHYEVVSVNTTGTPQVVMKVTQKSDLGLSPVDPHVQTLTLTMSDQMVQTRKSYQLAGRAQPVAASPNGLHSAITPLELFPLDVPELLTATRQKASSLPPLPDEVQSIAKKASYQPDLSKSSWFEQDDFFGRPVQVLWQNGDPWPAYLKTENGLAILIRKGMS